MIKIECGNIHEFAIESDVDKYQQQLYDFVNVESLKVRTQRNATLR